MNERLYIKYRKKEETYIVNKCFDSRERAHEFLKRELSHLSNDDEELLDFKVRTAENYEDLFNDKNRIEESSDTEKSGKWDKFFLLFCVASTYWFTFMTVFLDSIFAFGIVTYIFIIMALRGT